MLNNQHKNKTNFNKLIVTVYMVYIGFSMNSFNLFNIIYENHECFPNLLCPTLVSVFI